MAQETPANDGVYYMYNEANGLFLTRGETWGTQAVAKPIGMPWKVSVADGKYTLRMYDLTVAGSTSGFGDNCYSDNGSPLQFTPNGNATDGFTLQNGSNYITCPASAGAVSLSGTASSWKFLTQAQYDAVLAAKVAAQESAIATLKGITIPGGQSLNDVVSDGNNWRVSPTVNDGVPTSSKWTATKHSQRGGNTHWDLSYGTEMYECGNGHYTRTITGLTQGIYKVTIRGMKRMGHNATCMTMGNAGYPVSDSYMSANGYIIRFKAWYEDRASDSNPNNTGDFVNIVNNGGYTSEGFVYVGKDGNLVLDASSEAYWLGSWFLFNGISYTYYDNSVSDDDVNNLIATIPSHISNARAEAINNAKTTLLASKTIANYNALVAAIEAAQTSANEYAIIDAGVVPTNVISGWAKSTTNGELACNTWSTEGNTDGSGMTTPFIQDWVGSGTPLAGGNTGGKLYYSFTDLNPGETYVVTARVRVFNESGTGVTGASFFAGSNYKTLETFGSSCVGDFATKGKFAVLSCAGTVDANGDLQFGIELDAASPLNWISIKDVTIAAGTGDVPTAIELNKTSTTLTTGGVETLTATITPSTADDKTIIWSSSDESVVTVSGGNIVALKAGTATITATAYAGDNVDVACTVTVTDAAAPSFYSTTIAAGDYYIYNAATGLFLGGANSWGTQASGIEHGIPFTVTLGDGVYTLDSHTYNNADSHFFNGTYVDGSSTNLYITALTDGKFSISTADGSAFVTAVAGSTVVDNTAANADNKLAQWYFLSKNDRDKMLTAATALNPIDATYYVKQANISRNLSAGAHNQNAWSQYNVGGTQDNSNFAAQVYNAEVNNYQIINNIPNGTYTVSVQAFTSGTDVKFYANDQKVDVLANNSGATSCSDAAALFKQGLYPNTVTVTVTDRTLKIGFEGDCSDAKWLCYDKVEVYMTGYTAATGVSAELDKKEIQIGQKAQIIATTTPVNASFNAITSYTSSDESVATVDENGVVTGVAVGTATITVVANEMENNSATVDITVTLVTPTAFELSETEVALDKDNTSATLTITPTPDGANTAATWVSSDESVATVADGVVTAVSTGTATITATSVIDENVSAQATVTVTFPETEVAASTYTNDGATRTVFQLGANLIKNGAFEYPNNFYGWTTGSGAAMSSDNFTLVTEGDNHYITAKGHTGAGEVNSVGTGWAIEAGKTYVFGYKVKSTSAGNSEFHVVSLTNDLGTETTKVSKTETAVGTDWTDVAYTFTNPATDGYAYVQFRARWLNSAVSFDDFYLCEAVSTTEGNVDYATAAIPTANIGTGAFQYSQDAIDAANNLVQGTATVEDVENAYNALTTINEPSNGQLFNVILTYNGWTYDQKAMTYIANGRNDAGNYNIQYKEAANKNLAQAFTFTKVSGNNYKMSQIDADGNVRYISTGVPYKGNTGQIRTTTDASKALVVTVIPTATEGKWNLRNTEANQFIGSQDAGVFTVNSHIDFNIVETTKPSIEINTTAAGWGTVMLPFAQTLREGVKAYSCDAVSETTLTLAEVTKLEANKPYLVQGAWNETVTGDAQGTALTYTEGLFIGVYADQDAPVGSYVLQNKKEKLGFYRVAEGKQPTVGSNHAYLTVPAEANSRNAFFFGEGEGETTAISALKALSEGTVEIYNLNGVKQDKLQKGTNILKMSDGSIRKVIVK